MPPATRRIPRPRFFREDAAHQRRQRSRDRDIRQGDRLGDVIKQKSPAVRSQTRVERFERRLDVRSRASAFAENVRATRVEGVTREPTHASTAAARVGSVAEGYREAADVPVVATAFAEGTKRAVCEKPRQTKKSFFVFFFLRAP